MDQKHLIYIASGIGFLALIFSGWLFYQALFQETLTQREIGENNLNQLVFGRNPSVSTPEEEGVGANKEPSTSTIPYFGQIVSEPIAGYLPYTADKNDPSVVYMERGSGFVFSLSLKSGVKKRLSNTTIPKTIESSFVSTSTVLVRYENESGAQTLLGGIKSDGTLSGSILASDILWVIAEPTSQSIFYLRAENEGAVGYLSKPKQTPKKVFSSPLREWAASFLSKDKILLTTSASALSPSRGVLLDVAKNSETLLLSGVFGLGISGNSAGNKFLYSESSGGLFKSSLLDLGKSSTTPLTLETLSDKCAWGSGLKTDTVYCGIPLAPSTGNYPDDWYMGLTQFSDDLWSLDTKSNQYKFLVSPRKEADQSVDATNLSVSPDGAYLLFINKIDLSLWVLELKN